MQMLCGNSIFSIHSISMHRNVSIYLLLIYIFWPISHVTCSYNCTFVHHTNDDQEEITKIITVNRAEDCRCVDFGQECKNGLILPAWPVYPPGEPLTVVQKIVRGFVYLFTMLYAFLGVSILADKFMAAIETITSQERRVRVKKAERPGGEKVYVTVRIWNETVSNLTLMALGSSAPEILLSVIEAAGHNFKAGDLGPNTIVGSAAFNLFVIIAICVLVIPTPEVRRQQNLSVFMVTSSWSIFAYVWLYLIIAVISPGRIEIWEGLLTLAYFPMTVMSAWIVDREFIGKKLRSKGYVRDRRANILLASELQDPEKTLFLDSSTKQDPQVRAYEENRRIFMETFQRIRKEHPDADVQTVERMTEYEMMKNAKKSYAFHRVEAMRKLIGGGNIVRSKVKRMKSAPKTPSTLVTTVKGLPFDPATHVINIFFDPPQYTVMENVGTMKLKVSKTGTGWPRIKLDVLVDYRTMDGTAQSGSDYMSVNGTLRFTPGDQCFYIDVPIIDDDIFEEDEHFYVLLENLRVLDESTGRFIKNSTSTYPDIEQQLTKELPLAQILSPNRATVVILDDDHAGVFSIEHEEYIVPENSGTVNITVKRTSGARGAVSVPYTTLDGTAIVDKDYTKACGVLEFDNNETEKIIEIGIINKEEYERNEVFSLTISTPLYDDSVRSDSISLRDRKTKETAEKGRPKLGQISKCRIKIKESKEFKGLVDKMMKKANVSDAVRTSSWKEQFNDAFTVRGSEEEADQDLDEENLPTCRDYVMHFISVPWKLLAACCPPTECYNGWACFVATIFLIGLFTAMIGDLANHFGCTIGLKDAVTAISLVAMGTSVPDLFASKVAAVQDKYADSSIGNVTGSNAVNVFLGIGLAWFMCAVVSWLRSEANGFQVEPGSLAFSVTLFCSEAVICILVIIIRRQQCCGGGELGGTWKNKIGTAILFLGMWAAYVILSTLETYCVISGF